MTARARRTVVVTGANSGLGLASVVAVAKAGFHAVGTVRSDEKAEVVARAAADAGVEVATRLLDVTDADGCAGVIEELRPWGLVNNAGVGTAGAIEDVDDDEARRILEIMVIAPMRLARLAIPHQRAQGGGRTVNISSVYGFASTPLTGWYQGAKHALEGLTDALRMEVAGDGIGVVLVQPGGFETNIWREVDAITETRAGSRYETSYQRSQRVTDIWRHFMGSPDEVAGVVLKALEARRPRARYLVGRDALVISAAEKVGARPLVDRLTRLTLDL